MKCKVCIFGIFIFSLMGLAFTVHPQTLEDLTKRLEGRSMRASSGSPVDNNDAWNYKIGETKIIALLKGPGKISHIWLVPS